VRIFIFSHIGFYCMTSSVSEVCTYYHGYSVFCLGAGWDICATLIEISGIFIIHSLSTNRTLN